MEPILGINESELGNLSMEILDYKERINDIFDAIDKQVGSLDECYKGSANYVVKEGYNDIRKNYALITQNLDSYSSDLINLIKQVKIDSNYIAQLFLDQAEDMEAKTRIVKGDD